MVSFSFIYVGCQFSFKGFWTGIHLYVLYPDARHPYANVWCKHKNRLCKFNITVICFIIIIKDVLLLFIITCAYWNCNYIWPRLWGNEYERCSKYSYTNKSDSIIMTTSSWCTCIYREHYITTVYNKLAKQFCYHSRL